MAAATHTTPIAKTIAQPIVGLESATPALSPRVPGRATSLHLPAALQRLGEGDLVRVLEVSTDRESASQPRDGDAQWFEQRGDVHRGRVSLQVRVRREDDLLDAVALHTVEELLHAEVVRSNPIQRRDRAAEHVVPALDHAGLLDRRRVLRLLHDADHRRVSRGVPADTAQLPLCDVAALAAEEDLLLRVEERLREPL